MKKTLKKAALCILAASIGFSLPAFGMKQKIEELTKKKNDKTETRKKRSEKRKNTAENMVQIVEGVLAVEETVQDVTDLYKESVKKNGHLERLMWTACKVTIATAGGVAIIIGGCNLFLAICDILRHPEKAAKWILLLKTGNLTKQESAEEK